eukprot:GEMP01026178.1.p1 GENE.GEMP01026178.1~~GEMP01026178.1.p1  ORF type:complete len:186 (+),score=21.96 GEMP01026178.1:223-780(+)
MFDVINNFSSNKEEDVQSATDCGEDGAGWSSDCTNSYHSLRGPNQPRLRIPPQMLDRSISAGAALQPPTVGDKRAGLSPIPPGFGSYSRGKQGSDKGGSFNNLCGLGSTASTTQVCRRFITCTVGRKPTHARYYVDDVDDVNDLIMALKMSGKKRLPWSNADTMPVGRPASSKPGLESIFFEESG